MPWFWIILHKFEIKEIIDDITIWDEKYAEKFMSQLTGLLMLLPVWHLLTVIALWRDQTKNLRIKDWLSSV